MKNVIDSTIQAQTGGEVMVIPTLTLLGKTTFDRHIQVDVATAEHLVEKKRPRGKVPAYPDNPEVRDAYEKELRRLALRTVILDEAQHLIQSGDGKQPKDQLNWIKSMAIETGILHVLIGTYDLLPFCNLDGQMARRGSEFHFAPYHMEDENDCQAFRNALSSLLKQIPLQVDHDALIQRWWYFFHDSVYAVGWSKELHGSSFRKRSSKSLGFPRSAIRAGSPTNCESNTGTNKKMWS